jgi:acyl-CoA thioester hydrolase
MLCMSEREPQQQRTAGPGVVTEITVRYRDLDAMGHVNNAVYLTYFEHARFAYFTELVRSLGLEAGPGDPSNPRQIAFGPFEDSEFVVAESNVRYRAPAHLGDRLHCSVRVSRISRKTFVFEYVIRAGESFEAGQLVAEGHTVQVFFDPATGRSRTRPEWFVSAIAGLEGKSEEELKG